MFIIEKVISLEENQKEMDRFLQVELFILIKLKHFLGDFDKDSILGTPGAKNNLGVLRNDACLPDLLIIVH